MAAVGGSSATDFSKWLNNKLRELKTDETVFGTYITSILDGDDNNEEKIDALEGILSEILESNEESINLLANEILEQWKIFHPVSDSSANGTKISEDVDTKLARLLESKTLSTNVQKQLTDDERRIKEQILAQYSQLSGDEEEEDDEQKESETDRSLVKNTNQHDVQQALKERREQAKIDSQKKKDKDKEDREKQKQMREEKKEKRKTVKGERRR